MNSLCHPVTADSHQRPVTWLTRDLWRSWLKQGGLQEAFLLPFSQTLPAFLEEVPETLVLFHHRLDTIS